MLWNKNDLYPKKKQHIRMQASASSSLVKGEGGLTPPGDNSPIFLLHQAVAGGWGCWEETLVSISIPPKRKVRKNVACPAICIRDTGRSRQHRLMKRTQLWKRHKNPLKTLVYAFKERLKKIQQITGVRHLLQFCIRRDSHAACLSENRRLSYYAACSPTVEFK